MLREIQSALYNRAKAFRDSRIVTANSLEEFKALFPNTLELSAFAMLFAIIIGLPAGIVAAVRRGSIFDHLLMGGSLVGYSMPIFWWGLLLILGFSVNLHWTPVSGRIDLDYYVEPVTGFAISTMCALSWSRNSTRW